MDLEQTSWLDLDYQPKLPVNKSMGIGIVGAGDIVQACHLPAYEMAGFKVVGIFDVDTVKARQVAEKFKVKNVFHSLDELLAHPEVEIVDVAVPAKNQLAVVEKVVAKGKHVLCQKPLSENLTNARRLVELCAEANVKAAVNQQMRWAPGIRSSHTIIQRGWLGTLTQASIQVNVLTPWETWPWMMSIQGMEFMYHSIHYMDSIRFLFGTPEYIYADGARFPGQPWSAETRTMIHLKFPGEARGLIHDNHNNFASEDDWYATFRFEGTKGTIKGTNGALYNYPIGKEDSISFFSKEIKNDCWISPKLEGRWFPHAFMGTMGELMRAIEERREPENSVADNLKTLEMVFAASRSMQQNRPVWLEEID
ncbi:Gfo/Idh/MocA family oxidoreductase [Alicyclobacillus fastidiosus]|uniref:Gfo/Idh/MocA family oxidoreductase n=1 Tax=Alicyclobacillus fastidiosus TaxID=392011 RepID=A0ABY6ZN68_9BACL|nr:Gfo/Idh/MocA family oxidoreductase [Alicyclobacillus fastidiosus]WAH44408.1 Gfo/Idh/MocA family oxidoreductase [Alicyclobacillus fastidiosus]GMA60748.1 oxidoreductase [Alicyclobacillus fastidiosus]